MTPDTRMPTGTARPMAPASHPAAPVPSGPALGSGAHPSVRQALLELDGVRLWTPEGTVLLDRIGWTVSEGQHWALLGPNGAGKSTLLRIAAGVRHPSSGSVDVLGRRLGRVDVRTLWPHIGFVDPARRTPPELAVEDVVMTGATGTVQPLWDSYGAPEHRRATWLLEVMGADRLTGRAFGTCSDGERARVLIARSLMPAPRLLLLDEPTAGLDMAGREDLLAALAGLSASVPALASVVVAHHLEDLPVTTSHAMLLAAGRVVASGRVETVLQDATVSACFGVNVRIHRTAGRWAALHPERGPRRVPQPGAGGAQREAGGAQREAGGDTRG